MRTRYVVQLQSHYAGWSHETPFALQGTDLLLLENNTKNADIVLVLGRV